MNKIIYQCLPLHLRKIFFMLKNKNNIDSLNSSIQAIIFIYEILIVKYYLMNCACFLCQKVKNISLKKLRKKEKASKR